jgi:hypothetical protein
MSLQRPCGSRTNGFDATHQSATSATHGFSCSMAIELTYPTRASIGSSAMTHFITSQIPRQSSGRWLASWLMAASRDSRSQARIIHGSRHRRRRCASSTSSRTIYPYRRDMAVGTQHGRFYRPACGRVPHAALRTEPSTVRGLSGGRRNATTVCTHLLPELTGIGALDRRCSGCLDKLEAGAARRIPASCPDYATANSPCVAVTTRSWRAVAST